MMLDTATTERVMLALKILTSSLDPSAEGIAAQAEIDELRSHLGDEAVDLADDEVACLVIQREIKHQEERTAKREGCLESSSSFQQLAQN